MKKQIATICVYSSDNVHTCIHTSSSRLRPHKQSARRQAELCRRILAICVYISTFQTHQRQYKYAAGTCLEELARLRSRAGIASILLHPARPTAVRVASRAVIHKSCSLASPANEACPPALVVSSIIVDDIRTCTCAGLVMSCQACLGAEGATVYAVAIPLSVPCNLGHVATRVAAARRSQDT